VDEDDRAGRSIERLAVERERRTPGEHDVDLLVAERGLRVLLDDDIADAGGGIGVDPERADIERPSDRFPQERAVDDRDRLDLVQTDRLPAFGHRAL
jgi:hypothetical protein